MKTPVIFMGLFLIAFALYAQERMIPRAQVQPPVDPSAPKITEVQTPSDSKSAAYSVKVKELFDRMIADPVFQSRADGLKVMREPFSMMIQLSGDDVYAEGDEFPRETWYPLFDRVAAKLDVSEFKKGLRIELRGYSDEVSTLETKASDSGQSQFKLSFQRAEWVARYFERKFQMNLEEAFTLKAMGPRPNGRRVEIWMSYIE